MANHPIEGMMDVTMNKLKEMVDVNTIIGDPITTSDGTVIIPVSKVSYGFASGGSDFAAKSAPTKDLFGGGAGAGVTINPIAFLTVCNGEVQLMHIDEPANSAAEKAIGMAPELIDKVTSLFKKDKKENKEKVAEVDILVTDDSKTK